jgi:hypothetical protein
MTPYQRYLRDIALPEIALKGAGRRVAGLPRLEGVTWHASVDAAGRRDAPLAAAGALARLSGGPVGVVRGRAPRQRAGRGAAPTLGLWSRGRGDAALAGWHLWTAAVLATRRSEPPRLAGAGNGVAWTAPVDLALHPFGAAPRLEGVGARARVSLGIGGVSMADARMALAAFCLPL